MLKKTNNSLWLLVSVISTAAVILFGVGIAFISSPPIKGASHAEEIRQKIEDRNSRIEQLEEEINKYENKIEEVQGRKSTLENKVEELQVSQRRLSTDINLTQEKINATNLLIQELTNEIAAHENEIEQHKQAIAEAIRKIDEVDSNSLVEKILAHDNLSDIWETLDTLEKFQIGLREKVTRLHALKQELDAKREKQDQRRKELVGLRSELEDKRAIIADQKAQQNQLLKQTKNKEDNYRSLLSEKRQRKKQFEQELQQFEAQLQTAVDEGRLPGKGSSVLTWPVRNVRITQHFGNTRFAQSGAYNGSGHNGIDFGVPVGTNVLSAASGRVVSTGNTDNACPGASYGKWVLLEHDNGLSTLYAHLSLVKVSSGQSVTSGQTVGYSGNTGYSTGPHLHFTVYASQGVNVDTLRSSACAGAVYTLPLAPHKAYQNPLDYLPQ